MSKADPNLSSEARCNKSLYFYTRPEAAVDVLSIITTYTHRRKGGMG
jgi:hypothetical protein